MAFHAWDINEVYSNADGTVSSVGAICQAEGWFDASELRNLNRY